MNEFTVDVEREDDGRWIGEVIDLPCVLSYGTTREEAVARAKALAFPVLADRLDHNEDIPDLRGVFAREQMNWPSSRGCRIVTAANIC